MMSTNNVPSWAVVTHVPRWLTGVIDVEAALRQPTL